MQKEVRGLSKAAYCAMAMVVQQVRAPGGGGGRGSGEEPTSHKAQGEKQSTEQGPLRGRSHPAPVGWAAAVPALCCPRSAPHMHVS